MLMAMADTQLRAAGTPAPPRAANARALSIAKRIEIPVLACPDSLDIVAFNDWKARWADYLQLTRVGNELHDVASQQAFLRTLDSGWTEFWNAGPLGITGTEGIEAVVNRLGNYLRSRRNPLLDRQRFHARNPRPVLLGAGSDRPSM